MSSTAIDFPKDRSELDPAVNPGLPDPATGPLQNGDIFIVSGSSYTWAQDDGESYGRWHNEDPGQTSDERYVLKQPSSDQVINGAFQLSINDEITLNGDDGSASFAGNVNISDFDGGSGLILAANGTVNSSGNGLFGKRVQGYEQVEGGNNINASYGAVLYSNNATASQATIYARNYDNSGTGNLILCEGPTGGNAFTVNTSGSATFAGSVGAGNTTLNVAGFDLNISDGTNNVAQYSAGSGLFIGNAGSNNLIGNSAIQLSENGNIVGNVVRSASVLIETEPDNDANYTTTTDSEGNETRVYNGPTLDVKAMLQDHQARYEQQAATIASLQARIQTLEADIMPTPQPTPAPTPQPTPTPVTTNLIPDEWSHIDKLKALKELISEMNL